MLITLCKFILKSTIYIPSDDIGCSNDLDIALAPRQWGIAPNYRLRFKLTAETPHDRCPATDNVPKNDTEACRLTHAQQANIKGATYRILHDGGTPSSLNLPLLWNENLRRIETGDQPAAADSLLPMDTNVTLPLVW